MALKWESFPDETLNVSGSSRYGTTTYAMDIHVSKPCLISADIFIIRYSSMFANLLQHNFSLGAEGMGGGEGAVWASFTVNTLSK
jgi:hypothetical protein